MTVSPGATYTNDILGNRLTKGSATYGWDCFNRMVSYMNGSANETYGYRADGMRTFKSNSGSTTVYRYDGQMGMEDVDIAGATTDVTDYGLGARGIDYISYSVNGGTPSVSFPVYDAHGNMVATLARSGGGTYQVSNQRAYGAWGEIRQGATTGDPKGRYCANLGHKQDDESGLTYMRARYYDGVSGRLISQDSDLSGMNWFSYCRSNPVNNVDRTGCDPDRDACALLWMTGLFCGLCAAGIIACSSSPKAFGVAMLMAKLAIWLFSCSLGDALSRPEANSAYGLSPSSGGFFAAMVAGGAGAALTALMPTIATMIAGVKAGQEMESIGLAAVTAVFVYGLEVLGAVIATDS